MSVVDNSYQTNLLFKQFVGVAAARLDDQFSVEQFTSVPNIFSTTVMVEDIPSQAPFKISGPTGLDASSSWLDSSCNYSLNFVDESKIFDASSGTYKTFSEVYPDTNLKFYKRLSLVPCEQNSQGRVWGSFTDYSGVIMYRNKESVLQNTIPFKYDDVNATYLPVVRYNKIQGGNGAGTGNLNFQIGNINANPLYWVMDAGTGFLQFYNTQSNLEGVGVKDIKTNGIQEKEWAPVISCYVYNGKLGIKNLDISSNGGSSGHISGGLNLNCSDISSVENIYFCNQTAILGDTSSVLTISGDLDMSYNKIEDVKWLKFNGRDVTELVIDASAVIADFNNTYLQAFIPPDDPSTNILGTSSSYFDILGKYTGSTGKEYQGIEFHQNFQQQNRSEFTRDICGDRFIFEDFSGGNLEKLSRLKAGDVSFNNLDLSAGEPGVVSKGNITNANTINFSNKCSILGDSIGILTISGDLGISGTTTIDSTTVINGYTTVNNFLNITGGSQIGGGLTVDGMSRLNGGFNVNNDAIITGSYLGVTGMDLSSNDLIIHSTNSNKLIVDTTLDMSCNNLLDVSSIEFCNDIVNYTQDTNSASIEIGNLDTTTGDFCGNRIHLGRSNYNISIGYNAGSSDQSANTIAIGRDAGTSSQNNNAIAIGREAGNSNQSYNAIAIGIDAGYRDQSTNAIGIGPGAGETRQNQNAIAIGGYAGKLDQSERAIAIGPLAGEDNQQGSAVAIGIMAGKEHQSDYAIAIGAEAGKTSQSNNAIAIGYNAGYQDQSYNAIAIGHNAGYVDQSRNAVAIGRDAGQTNQSRDAIAIGTFAGNTNQNQFAIGIGQDAGKEYQSENAISIGRNAGQSSQSQNAIAIGYNAGNVDQSGSAIAIGREAGDTSQNEFSISIGRQAGQIQQKKNSIAIGNNAGRNNQGENSIAIGQYAGYDQSSNSIILNAQTDILLTSDTSGLFIAPIREDASGSNILVYDLTSKEIKYSENPVLSSLTITGATIIFQNLPTSDPGTSGALYRDISGFVKISL